MATRPREVRGGCGWVLLHAQLPSCPKQVGHRASRAPALGRSRCIHVPASDEGKRAVGPDVALTGGTARRLTPPLGSHLLRQLDPPGRNVTGVSHVAPLPAQLNAIRGYRPFKRLGYIVNPKESNTQLVADALGKLAKEQGFELVQETVPLDATGNPDPHALKDVIDKIAARKVDFLYIGPSTFLAFTHRDLVTELALQAKLPTFCATESIVRKARCMFGLFSHGSNVGRFAAHKAAQVLAEGKRVDTIPAETLQRFSLLINMPTVKALDLYPPLALLNVAEVIQ